MSKSVVEQQPNQAAIWTVRLISFSSRAGSKLQQQDRRQASTAGPKYVYYAVILFIFYYTTFFVIPS